MLSAVAGCTVFPSLESLCKSDVTVVCEEGRPTGDTGYEGETTTPSTETGDTGVSTTGDTGSGPSSGDTAAATGDTGVVATGDTGASVDTGVSTTGDTGGTDTGLVPFPRQGWLRVVFGATYDKLKGFVQVRDTSGTIMYEAWPDESTACLNCSEVVFEFELEETWFYVQWNLEVYVDNDTADTGGMDVATWGAINDQCDHMALNPDIVLIEFDQGLGVEVLDLVVDVDFVDNYGEVNPDWDEDNDDVCDADVTFNCCYVGGDAVIYRE